MTDYALPRPIIGKKAPDITALDLYGNTWKLSDHLGAPTLVIFHRHLNCLACIQHVAAVRWRVSEFEEGTQLLLVAFSKTDELKAYAEGQKLPFTILQDSEQESYRTYGLAKGTFANLYGFKALSRYAKIIRKDGFSNIRKPVEDWQQLGGDFVIGRDGTLTYGYWSEGPGDRPHFDTLRDEVRAAATPPPPRPSDLVQAF